MNTLKIIIEYDIIYNNIMVGNYMINFFQLLYKLFFVVNTQLIIQYVR